jgi:glucokinase
MAAPPTPRPLIVADIGATNARFAVIEALGRPPVQLHHFGDKTFHAFEDCLAAYLAALGERAPRAIAIGAAGPLANGGIKLTNRDWMIEPSRLARRFGLETLALANDLVASAAGIALAPSTAFLALSEPSARPTWRSLVIAVGTGLGVAWFERDGKHIVLHPSEAGHMLMAPAQMAESRLVTSLIDKLGSISFESIASGSGMPRVYAALRGPQSPQLPDTEAVLGAAEAKSNETAQIVLDLALGALATFARDLVLALGGVDEIVFAGGLGVRLSAALNTPTFIRRLRQPGDVPLDFSHIDLRLAVDETLALTGAANLAFGLVECRELSQG